MRRTVLTILLISTAILFLTRNLYLPLILRPSQNFLYAAGPPYYAQSQYVVEGGTVRRQAVRDYQGYYPYEKGPVQLFIYDVKRDEARQTTYREAERLKLVPQDSKIRPQEDLRSNGYAVSYGRKSDPSCGRSDFGLCPRSDYGNVWLEGWTTFRRLDIDVSYGRSFEFLGWIDE